MSESSSKIIAFYLPQFHPIPENDRWWGTGFTEWTNVTRATPRFKDHYQPHLPADLGFYDLRLPEIRDAQAALASEYRIDGFCYYHYWFGGKRLLERPFNEVLNTGRPRLPFCLCWANEQWTRGWDGREGHVLMPQAYSPEDDLAHIRWLVNAFRDERYIRVDGKPLFLVYRSAQLPDALRTTTIWRDEARKLGIDELYLCNVQSFQPDTQIVPEDLGFDAAVEFMPRWDDMGQRLHFHGRKWKGLRALGLADAPAFSRDRLYSYAQIAQLAMQRELPPYKYFRCVTPSWDNSARREQDATILDGSTPELFGRWLRFALKQSQKHPEKERLIFINAWNEWAEGNHLEPCLRWGRAYLESTREAVELIDSAVDENLDNPKPKSIT